MTLKYNFKDRILKQNGGIHISLCRFVPWKWLYMNKTEKNNNNKAHYTKSTHVYILLYSKNFI